MAKANILLIDDDKEFAQDMKEILGVQGYQVSAANSPPEASRLLRQEKPDLILLDIGMPMHDGRRFCTYLKRQERYRDMPVLIMSGRSEHEVEWAAELSQADGYITKPFEPKQLGKQIENLLKK